MNEKAVAIRLLEEAQRHIEAGMNGMWDAGYIDGLIESALIVLDQDEPGAQPPRVEGN
ncbi:hypothetical protein H6A16_04430 [Collinsella tanakaei]|uniref:hypothetical protein n=1 Tax=Collinsella tanakaei TaxID=626935 RepID=UPI001958D550|nr:hypothetical protein [Collinsella tanakaei]MBM6778742.1 hypothetical protein [Collinsella tanakaei]